MNRTIAISVAVVAMLVGGYVQGLWSAGETP